VVSSFVSIIRSSVTLGQLCHAKKNCSPHPSDPAPGKQVYSKDSMMENQGKPVQSSHLVLGKSDSVLGKPAKKVVPTSSRKKMYVPASDLFCHISEVELIEFIAFLDANRVYC
jgi:hypothetical protein